MIRGSIFIKYFLITFYFCWGASSLRFECVHSLGRFSPLEGYWTQRMHCFVYVVSLPVPFKKSDIGAGLVPPPLASPQCSHVAWSGVHVGIIRKALYFYRALTGGVSK